MNLGLSLGFAWIFHKRFQKPQQYQHKIQLDTKLLQNLLLYLTPLCRSTRVWLFFLLLLITPFSRQIIFLQLGDRKLIIFEVSTMRMHCFQEEGKTCLKDICTFYHNCITDSSCHLEHCVHRMAIMRPALLSLRSISGCEAQGFPWASNAACTRQHISGATWVHRKKWNQASHRHITLVFAFMLHCISGTMKKGSTMPQASWKQAQTWTHSHTVSSSF